MYTYAHPIEDALENITHSICTLEFEDQRPFYDWLLEQLADLGLLARPLPKQYEFARLNVTYVDHQQAQAEAAGRQKASSTAGTTRACRRIVGLRRRGYTPEAIQLFCERIGRQQGRRLDRLRERSTPRCATTSKARRRARWPCSIR